MRSFVEAGPLYEEVKRVVAIPSAWGAKISGEQFAERAEARLEPKGKRRDGD
jgi:hypothetical protein